MHHVSSRDSPQSLEFWEDGRQPTSELTRVRHSGLSMIIGRVGFD